MPLPNFLCVGAQKAGTTSLYHILKQHPAIFLPKCKEVRFFNNDKNYSLGVKWYKKKFDSYENNKIYGDFTPDYMFIPIVVKRIYSTLGEDLKLLFILRNPVERAYSHYKMNKRSGFEKKSFIDALKSEPIEKTPNQNKNNKFTYIRRGLYAQQIKRFLKHYSLKNMLFVSFERLFVLKERSELNKILSFLDIEEKNLPMHFKKNTSRVPPNMLGRIFFHKSSPIQKYRKVILPSKKARKRLSNLLSKKSPTLQEDVKNSLFQKYFKKDFDELKTITSLEFFEWFQNSASYKPFHN